MSDRKGAKMMLRAGLVALVACTVVACGGSGNKSGSDGGSPPVGSDMSKVVESPPDLATPPCVMDPTTGNDFLNACTTAQTGDPKKDYPYYPKLAPHGNLPPIN